MNMKKISVTLVSLFMLNQLYGAELSKDRSIETINIDTAELKGKVKAGISLGYPTGITAGYRFSNYFEMNGTFGTDFDSFTLGGNGLFTIARFKIGREIFPFSAGPAAYIDTDHHTDLDVLGMARIEYDFKQIPLNLFVEAGLGLRIIEFADIAGSFAVGVRYIF